MNLNSILIGSEDPQRLTDFYSKLFGEPGWEDGGYTGVQSARRAAMARPIPSAVCWRRYVTVKGTYMPDW